jgi:uncharacterized protein YecE (DUF72 family)
MRIFAGTSGFSYKEWKGSFYPADLPDKQMLRYYGERFGTVEINNTFYRMPSESVLKNWCNEVPPAFLFVLKAPQRITHREKLEESEGSVAYFFKTAAALGDRLGPILFQLPPFFRKDLPRLRKFLDLLPKKRRVAFEFRHASWFEDEVYESLREHDAALCIAEADDDLEVPFVATASWGYVRLRRADYGDADLRRWGNKLQSQVWNDVFLFFKHEDEGKGPQLAGRFLELMA